MLQAPGCLLSFDLWTFFWPVVLLIILSIRFSAEHFGCGWQALFAGTSLVQLRNQYTASRYPPWGPDPRPLGVQYHGAPATVRSPHQADSLADSSYVGLTRLLLFLRNSFLLASEVELPVNTMYVSRYTKEPNCSLREAPIEVRPKELLVFLPEHIVATTLLVADWRDFCRQLGVLVACSQELRQRTDLPTPAVPLTPIGKELSTGTNGMGSQALGFGWSFPEPWDVWSEGPTAQLLADVSDASNKPILLTVWAHALAFHPRIQRAVAVVANGRPAGRTS